MDGKVRRPTARKDNEVRSREVLGRDSATTTHGANEVMNEDERVELVPSSTRDGDDAMEIFGEIVLPAEQL